MNTYVSYRKLLANSKQAMVAAIEIYNKPKFEYREEIFSILISNSWELLLLAILSKNQKRIFKKKERDRDYQILNFDEIVELSKMYFPDSTQTSVIIENIRLIRKYRNLATHYYNDEQHKYAIYALASASLFNYQHLVLSLFDQNIADEVNIVLLPLSFNKPPDFIEYFKSARQEEYTPFINDLLSSLEKLTVDDNADTSRLITRCTIKLEPKRNIKSADIIAARGQGSVAHVIERSVNPDDSHPFFQKDIIGFNDKPRHRNLNRELSSYEFQAVLWGFKVKEDMKLCWKSDKAGSPRYTPKIFDFLNELSDAQVKDAKLKYASYLKTK